MDVSGRFDSQVVMSKINIAILKKGDLGVSDLLLLDKIRPCDILQLL